MIYRYIYARFRVSLVGNFRFSSTLRIMKQNEKPLLINYSNIRDWQLSWHVGR